MNINRLPEKFIENTRDLFSRYLTLEEYEIFLESLTFDYVRGIRYNSLKVESLEIFKTLLKKIYLENEIPPEFERVTWSDDGLYIPSEFFPGRHFYYNAGLFYIQEPSAMLPTNVLAAKPGEKILDLCAAPGGKSVKIAADMKGSGILFSNDINETRVKALVRNIELMGCTNCVVLNESPAKIAKMMPLFFDKILLDAPCSGEGMFRRDSDAATSWEKFGNDSCVIMQKDILLHVDELLKPGGILVYSTCTFSTKENEDMILWFCNEFPWYEILTIDKVRGVDNGIKISDETTKTARIFPHHAKGEGHFCAKLIKNPQKATTISCSVNNLDETSICGIDSDKNNIAVSGSNESQNKYYHNSQTNKNTSENRNKIVNINAQKVNLSIKYNNDRNSKSKNHVDYSSNSKNYIDYSTNKKNSQKQGIIEFDKEQFIKAFEVFSKDVLTSQCIDRILLSCNLHLQIVNGHVYTLPEAIPLLDGLKIAKKGWYLGELKNSKKDIVFEPSHSFLLALNKTELLRKISFSSSDQTLLKYMKGETIFYPNLSEIADKGYIPICVDDYPLGWGKVMSGDMIKNLYPQGWRKS